MAKPERHPWPYGPQWNYYPPHVLNFTKLPFPNGPPVNVNTNENYFSIRCPEPRRPYHVPYSSFSSYCHQESHPVHSYMQASPVYSPKQYMYRPLCQENIKSTHKVTENLQSYPACSNYSLTKDQNPCYQTTWNNTSHYQRNPPELDVRHFLATWKEKDDDFVDLSTESEPSQIHRGSDSIPLDCSKRNNNDRIIRKNYPENLYGGQSFNTTGYFVPYYLKDDPVSLNRPMVSEELNNNVLHRNNLNYDNNQGYSKNFYSNSVKFPTSKLHPCEHFSYSQSLNHCDINSNQLRNTVNQPRQKDVLDSLERSQYNLTSSLESGELFCDINPRNEEIQKPPVIHPIFNDLSHKLGVEDQCYFGNENNEFSENLILSDLNPLKDSWDMFSTNYKAKDNVKLSNCSKSVNKVSPQNLYEQSLPNNNGSSNNMTIDSSTCISYEGAFNILPNNSLNNLHSNQLNSNNCVLTSHDSLKPVVSSHSVATTLVSSHSVTTSKIPSNLTKTLQANTKIRPYQFNEEISSDDIDISITSSDFIVDEDNAGLTSTSVSSISKIKKEKNNSFYNKSIKNYDIDKNKSSYSCPVFNDEAEKITPSVKEDVEKTSVNDFPEDNIKKPTESEEKVNDCKNNITPIKGDAMDLSVLKPPDSDEKDSICYLDISSNFMRTTDLVEKSNVSNNFSQSEINIPKDTSEKCEISVPKEPTSDSIFNNSEDISDSDFVQDPNFPSLEDSVTHGSNDETFSEINKTVIPNDNLLLLAHCSQEYGCQIKKHHESNEDESSLIEKKTDNQNKCKYVRDSVIKCSLRWDRIFNIMSNEDNLQPDMSLDLGPAKVELRMPSDNCTSNHWKIVEADCKMQTSSIVQVKRLILKRKNQSEERIPKMIIKKTEGKEYRSYLKKESSQTVLHCEKLKIYCDKLSKSSLQKQEP